MNQVEVKMNGEVIASFEYQGEISEEEKERIMFELFFNHII